MCKRMLSAFLVLVMTLSFAACVGGPSAQEIINNVIESQADITTYRFDMNMNIDVDVNDEGETYKGVMAMDVNGALDIENEQMEADINMSYLWTGGDEVELTMEMYIVDNMVYMMTWILYGPMWTKSEIPVDYWEDIYQIEPQIKLLDEAVQVKVIGNEEAGGIDCYILEITPDMEQLWQIVMQQSGVTGEEMLPGIDEEFLQEVFQGFSVKQWIAKDTYFLAKVEMDMTLELTPESLGLPEEEGLMTMDITMDFLAYDYNQPVSIVLPPGAEDATETPMTTSVTSERILAANTEAHDVEIAVLAAMVDNNIFELTPGGTVGPDHTAIVFASDGVTRLPVVNYFIGDVDAIYTLDAGGHIISAVATSGGRWDGLYYVENIGWQD